MEDLSLQLQDGVVVQPLSKHPPRQALHHSSRFPITDKKYPQSVTVYAGIGTCCRAQQLWSRLLCCHVNGFLKMTEVDKGAQVNMTTAV